MNLVALRLHLKQGWLWIQVEGVEGCGVHGGWDCCLALRFMGCWCLEVNFS